jgi:hypothetical protein
MAGKGQGSVSASVTTEQYKNVLLQPLKLYRVPIFQEVHVTSLNLFANYGITDKLDAVVSLPYIKSTGRADERVIKDTGYTNTREGIQDITALLKYKAFSRELGTNVLDLLAVASVSTPLGNYKTEAGLDYIIAIGNRATKYSGLGVAHLKTVSGVFVTAQGGYSLRNNRVPNAIVSEAKVGYAGPKTYVEGYASFQYSTSGTDIVQEGFDGFFPATRVSYGRAGANAFRPIAKGLGVSLGASAYFAGRNVGQSVGFSAGATYNF